jgi:hypothetical protein
MYDADIMYRYIYNVLAGQALKLGAKRGANILTINGLAWVMVPARPGWGRKSRFYLLEGGGPWDWKPSCINFLPPFCFGFDYPLIPFLWLFIYF